MTLITAFKTAGLSKMRGMKVGLTCGAFDLLHVNHVKFLGHASGLCDVLIVAVNTDRVVKLLKGPNRPITPELERCAIVQAIKGVTYAFIFDDMDPCQIIEKIHPHVFFKGVDRVGQEMPETPLLQQLGIELELIGPPKDHSTTDLIARCAREKDPVPDAPPVEALPEGF